MFRYRCPHCTKLLQAPEVRAGKTTVCSKCSQPLTIPIDKSEWLNERGEPLLHSPTVVIKTPPPQMNMRVDEDKNQTLFHSSGLEHSAPRLDRDDHFLNPPFQPSSQPGSDVFGAISSGTIEEIQQSQEPIEISQDQIKPYSSTLSAILGDSSIEYQREQTEPQSELREVIPTPIEPVSTVWNKDMAESLSHSNHSNNEPLQEMVSQQNFSETADVSDLPEMFPPQREEELLAVSPASWESRKAEDAAASQPEIMISLHSGLESHLAATTKPDQPPERSYSKASEPAEKTSQFDQRLPKRMVAPTPQPPRPTVQYEDEMGESRSRRIKLDYVSDLTSALTSRMKPPPSPPRDLRPSTAFWMLSTGAGVSLLLLSMVSSENYIATVLGIAIAQIITGYIWITLITLNRGWDRGLWCALFPITLWYLTRYKYAKLRPLRFFATGMILLGLAVGGSYILPSARHWVGVREPLPATNIDPTSQPALAQLESYLQTRSYDSLRVLLHSLATSDPIYSKEAPNREKLAEALYELCKKSPDQEIKIDAMAAYAKWGGEKSRLFCLQSLTRSTNQEERIEAIRQLPKWPDAEVARAIATRIGKPGLETSAAQSALIQIGGPIAEKATIPLLRDPSDQGVRLIAMEILANERVGGPDAVIALREESLTSSDLNIRQPASIRADQIQERLNKAKMPKAPKP